MLVILVKQLTYQAKMKTLSYFLILFSLLISCQKEKLLPDIYLTYEVASNGLLEGRFVLNNASYQVDYGDESPVEKGIAINYAAFYIKHNYLKKGTFTMLITVTNNSGIYQYRREIKIRQLAYPIVADFKYTLGDDGRVGVNFLINDGDRYELDFGDGQVIKDSLNNSRLPENYQMYIGHQYKKIGNYKIRLTISNIEGKASSEQTINVAYIPPPVIADFSYELLENGRVKLKNLSQNTLEYQWSIEHLNSGNSYPFYISNEKDIEVVLDLAGNYFVRLDATSGKYKSSITKLINIKSAKNQMEFSGYIKGNKIEGSMESNHLSYRYGFGLSSGFSGLFQSIYNTTNKNDSLQLDTLLEGEFFPLLPYSLSSVPTQLERYEALKKYLTKENNPSLIEVSEVDLDPQLYNNTARYYPKAFWITYKLKNDILDGIIKVRIIVYGSK